MEDRDLLCVDGGGAESKLGGSSERWVLLVKKEQADKVVKVILTNVAPKGMERGAGVPRGWVRCQCGLG